MRKFEDAYKKEDPDEEFLDSDDDISPRNN